MRQEGRSAKAPKGLLAPMMLGHIGMWASGALGAGFLAPVAYLALRERGGVRVFGVLLFALAVGLVAWLAHNVARLPDWAAAAASRSDAGKMVGLILRCIVAVAAIAGLVYVAWVLGRLVFLKKVTWGLGRHPGSLVLPLLAGAGVCGYALWAWREFLRVPDWAQRPDVPLGLKLLGHLGWVQGTVKGVAFALLTILAVAALENPKTLVTLLCVLGALDSVLCLMVGCAIAEQRRWARLGSVAVAGVLLCLSLTLLIVKLALPAARAALSPPALSIAFWVLSAGSAAFWAALLAGLMVYMTRPRVVDAFRAAGKERPTTGAMPAAVKAIGDVGLWLSIEGCIACVMLLTLGATRDSGANILNGLLFGLVAALGVWVFRGFLDLGDWRVAPEVPLGVKLVGHLGRVVGSLAMASCIALLVLTIVLPAKPRPGLALVFFLGMFISLLVRMLGSAVSELRHWARPASLVVTGLAVAFLTVALVLDLVGGGKASEAAGREVAGKAIEGAGATIPLAIFLGASAVLFVSLLVYFMLPRVAAVFQDRRL